MDISILVTSGSCQLQNKMTLPKAGIARQASVLIDQNLVVAGVSIRFNINAM
jgi:hypothetical protein